MTYPPNPIRNLDNSLTPLQQAAGQNFYFNHAANGAGAAVRPLPQLQRLPHARSQRQRRRRPRTPASSAPTAGCRSSSRRSSSRSRTCGTCTRRSACSAARPTNMVGTGCTLIPQSPDGPGAADGARLRLPARRRARHARALLHGSGVHPDPHERPRHPQRRQRRPEPVRHPAVHVRRQRQHQRPRRQRLHAAARDRVVRARVRFEHEGDRRPAGHADRRERCRCAVADCAARGARERR